MSGKENSEQPSKDIKNEVSEKIINCLSKKQFEHLREYISSSTESSKNKPK